MKTLQFREAIAEAMSEEMRKDESIASYRHTHIRIGILGDRGRFCYDWQQTHY
jgi:hypothetical protein